MNAVQRVFFGFLFICLLPTHLLGSDLLDYLKNYEGRWVGVYSIHSTANGHTESFTVEQRYWWQGNALHGLAVFERGSGMETASSKTWMDGEKLIAEVKRGEATESFYGVLHEGGLLWLPKDMKRANDYQMRESFVEKEGKPKKLRTEGFDTYIHADGLVHLIYKGELTLQAEEK